MILLGLVALLAASSRDGTSLFLACFGFALAALVTAIAHLGLLLRRSRWLLLTMLVMFGWLTPGTPLPGIPGASQEGLLLAAESIARLLIALSVVAMLLQKLPPTRLVAGIRSLLTPLALLGIPRDRVAVRLALTLQAVENSRTTAEYEEPMPGTLSLPATEPGAIDVGLGLLTCGLAIMAVLA
ncbi:MAG: hypothetical protein K9K30_13850 [Burkholderiaceae bacterium]|nr:hypothetical protein [Sulfuritalea sp.]MCF8176318.1 hypothetical protein [Burkholderiaceae bacterium]